MVQEDINSNKIWAGKTHDNEFRHIFQKTPNEPFRRVKSENIYVDPRFKDNSFEAKVGWNFNLSKSPHDDDDDSLARDWEM